MKYYADLVVKVMIDTDLETINEIDNYLDIDITCDDISIAEVEVIEVEPIKITDVK